MGLFTRMGGKISSVGSPFDTRSILTTSRRTFKTLRSNPHNPNSPRFPSLRGGEECQYAGRYKTSITTLDIRRRSDLSPGANPCSLVLKRKKTLLPGVLVFRNTSGRSRRDSQRDSVIPTGPHFQKLLRGFSRGGGPPP